MYRFALRPRWLLSHLLALAIVTGCVVAGFWQLDRLDQRREVNARQEARSELPVAPAVSLLSPGDVPERVDEVELRTVEATGTWRVEDQVLVSNRTHDGAAGFWVITPLVSDGVGVLVNRGWVPMTLVADDELRLADPPNGTSRVLGTLTASQVRGRFGATDPDEGVLDRVARADVARIAAQLDYPVLPAYVTLVEQQPTQPASFPVPVRPVELGEGPHLGYAFQWFTFATIAAFGYLLILRKVARERATEATGAGPGRRRSSKVPVED